MLTFTETEQSASTNFRAITLFGKNTASYKFALGQSLLELANQQQSTVSLEQLAVPFLHHILRHLELEPKQTTSRESRFLTELQRYAQSEISLEAALIATEKDGFRYVLDAFHTVGGGVVPISFFSQEKNKVLHLTDELLAMPQTVPFQFSALTREIEARWRLVETAWSLNIIPSALMVQPDQETQSLFVLDSQRKRRDLTSTRDALNGYQKGYCFYCEHELSLLKDDLIFAEVDHFFPHTLMQYLANTYLDGVWNLVLACVSCNRGNGGKFARIPALTFLQKLFTRNEYLIYSHHPLRETLINQTGNTSVERRAFLQSIDRASIELLIHRWSPNVNH